MKLTDIIVEGYRFGAKERKIVDKYANKIKVGFEAEFMVHGYGDEYGDFQNLIIQLPDLFDAYVVNHALVIDGLLRLANGDTSATTKEMLIERFNIMTENKLNRDVNIIVALTKDDDYASLLETLIDSYDRDGFDGILDRLDTIKKYETEIRYLIKSFSTGEGQLKKVFSDIPVNLSDLYEAIKDDPEFSHYYEDLVDDISIAIRNHHGIDGDLADDIAEQIVQSVIDSYFVGSSVLEISGDVVSSKIDNAGEGPDLDDLIMDLSEFGTVEEEQRANQMELVTEPVNFNGSLVMVKHIFDALNYYESEGDLYIDDGCGLHVNMSIQNERFTPDNLNHLKLYLFMSESYMVKGGKEIVGFEPRKYVESIYKQMIWQDFARMVAVRYAEGIPITKSVVFNRPASLLKDVNRLVSVAEDVFEILFDDEKYIQINIQHMREHKKDLRRVEFRFPGGDDYHKRYKDVEAYLYRMAYMLMASVDSKAGYKEYVVYLMKLLDKLSNDTNNMTFAQLVSYVIKDKYQDS